MNDVMELTRFPNIIPTKGTKIIFFTFNFFNMVINIKDPNNAKTNEKNGNENGFPRRSKRSNNPF